MRVERGAQLQAVDREVTWGRRDGRDTRTVVARTTYGVGVEELWDALTNPDRLPRWFLPVTGELRLGGRYQLQGHAGGVIEDCAEPHRLDLTWEYGDAMSWLRVRLEPAPNGTVLELRHEAFLDDHWSRYGPGAAGLGWDMALVALGQHLQGASSSEMKQVEAWFTTPDGVGFLTEASDAWGTAAEAAGEDPAQARAAAERATAAYTDDQPAS